MGALTETDPGNELVTRHNRTITFEEVQKHNTPQDCWVVVDDFVYDVSKFVPIHPGGKIIGTYAGKDCTDVFYAFHGEMEGSPGITSLARYKIGKLDKPLNIPAHLADFRELRKEVQKEGLMKANIWWFSRLLFFYSLTFICTIIALFIWRENWFVAIAAGTILGCAWAQGGLLQHDLGHNAVFFDCKTNYLVHVFFYTFLMGGSADWWRARHTRHHASPNDVHVDLDIRTLPLFAWDSKQFKKAKKEFVKFQWAYWPVAGPPAVLFIYRILNTLWLLRRKVYFEIFGTCFHLVYFSWLTLYALNYNVLMWCVYIASIYASGGGYLGWIFALNHTMFPIYRGSEERDWVSATLSTTQNINPSLFMDYYTGHLDYQIEHHLWPRMPRHNYEKVHPRLIALCAKHNIPFYQTSFLKAAIQVVQVLIGATKEEIPDEDKNIAAKSRISTLNEPIQGANRRATIDVVH